MESGGNVEPPHQINESPDHQITRLPAHRLIKSNRPTDLSTYQHINLHFNEIICLPEAFPRAPGRSTVLTVHKSPVQRDWGMYVAIRISFSQMTPPPSYISAFRLPPSNTLPSNLPVPIAFRWLSRVITFTTPLHYYPVFSSLFIYVSLRIFTVSPSVSYHFSLVYCNQTDFLYA